MHQTAMTLVLNDICQFLQPTTIPISWVPTRRVRSIRQCQNRDQNLYFSALSHRLTAASSSTALPNKSKKSTKRQKMNRHAQNVFKPPKGTHEPQSRKTNVSPRNPTYEQRETRGLVSTGSEVEGAQEWECKDCWTLYWSAWKRRKRKIMPRWEMKKRWVENCVEVDDRHGWLLKLCSGKERISEAACKNHETVRGRISYDSIRDVVETNVLFFVPWKCQRLWLCCLFPYFRIPSFTAITQKIARNWWPCVQDVANLTAIDTRQIPLRFNKCRLMIQWLKKSEKWNSISMSWPCFNDVSGINYRGIVEP